MLDRLGCVRHDHQKDAGVLSEQEKPLELELLTQKIKELEMKQVELASQQQRLRDEVMILQPLKSRQLQLIDQEGKITANVTLKPGDPIRIQSRVRLHDQGSE